MNKLIGLMVLILCTACTALANAQATTIPTQISTSELPVQAALPEAFPSPDSASPIGYPLAVWQSDSNQVSIRMVNPLTGKDLPGFLPLILGHSESGYLLTALSADGQRAAVTFGNGSLCEPYTGGSYCMGAQDRLILVDIPAGSSTEIELPGAGWVEQMAFNPQGTRLAVVYHQLDSDTLLMVDPSQSMQLTNRSLPFVAGWMGYALQGAQIALLGAQPGEPPGVSRPQDTRLLLLDADTLEPAWEQTLDGLESGEWCLESCETMDENTRFVSYQPGISLSPDTTDLYVTHPGENLITHLDLSAHLSQVYKFQAPQSWLERLLALTASPARAKIMPFGEHRLTVVSPDGSTILIATQTLPGSEPTEAPPLTIQAVDLSNSEVIHQVESSGLQWLKSLRMAPNSDQVLLSGWDSSQARTEIYDLSLMEVGYLDGWLVDSSVAAGGAPALLASDNREFVTRLGALDEYYEIYHPWSVGGYAQWVTSAGN